MPESKDSMSLEQWMADFTIDNNGTLDDLWFNIKQLMSYIHT
jgi:dephospho-CoA kinase